MHYFLILLLAGCVPAHSSDVTPVIRPGGWNTQAKKINVDGVECIVLVGHKAGGISCNWNSHK